jgi:ubiquinol-cytochrome c reductase cytochrome b/c1 subunit
MSGHSTYVPKSAIGKWFESRLPIMGLMHSSFVAYPVPRNLNYFWTFGAILMFMLISQIITGIVLVMHYTPHVDHAFASVEHIMRDVNYGWLLRYLHANGASMFFIAVYIHMFRGLYYGSYKAPREVLWILGVIIFLLMMATAFMGYVLPWGQMSFWGATVITNLFSAVPVVGETIVNWLWGGYSVDNPTLNRFFSLHYLLPFMIFGVVILHVWALHVSGQNNPTGVEVKTKQDVMPFTPYATVKDIFAVVMFLIFFSWFVFYIPNYLGHADNYIEANPLVTPAHIVPEWYFLPFYAILRAVPDKLGGVLAMFGSIAILAFLPWLDTSKVRSAVYRPLYKQFFWIFAAVCVLLGWLGSKPAEGIYVVLSRICTVYYFAHFLIILPLLGLFEKPKPLPASIADSIKSKAKVAGAAAAVILALVVANPQSTFAAGEGPKPDRQVWSFAGPVGTYDRAQLQRGFKVYREVCASCHGLSKVSFRNLSQPGGPEFSPDQVKTLAAEYKVKDGPNDSGEMFERAGRPSDRFPKPFANEQAARAANGGAYPPDFSVLAKARSYTVGFPGFVIDAFRQYQEHGPDYIYALLTGYTDAPAGVEVSPGLYYNVYFPGNKIAMAQPISDGQVEYTDGSPQTVKQYAKDVTAFMMWASEPHLEARKRLGLQVMLFLVVFAGLLYFSKKKLFSGLGAH